MSKLTAEVRVAVDGHEVHAGTVTVDTDESGTPWLVFIASMVDVGVAAQRKHLDGA